MATNAAAQAELCRLRRDIARLEGRLADEQRLVLDSAAPGEAAGQQAPPLGPRPRRRPGQLTLGAPRLDRVLGGGLMAAALHEIRAEETRDGAAAAGFVMALLARLAEEAEAPFLWISSADSRREAGELYAPGLVALGLDPSRLIRVAVRSQAEALWAFEAALACRGLAMAVCEMRRPSLDLTATRRCAMRARDGGVTGFVLRLGAGAEPTAAETRFRLAPSPAGEIGDFAAGVGRMAWRLVLEKNRGGRTGIFTLEWNAHERSFAEFSGAGGRKRRADPQPVASPPAHGPAHPPGDGEEGRAEPWRRAS